MAEEMNGSATGRSTIAGFGFPQASSVAASVDCRSLETWRRQASVAEIKCNGHRNEKNTRATDSQTFPIFIDLTPHQSYIAQVLATQSSITIFSSWNLSP